MKNTSFNTQKKILAQNMTKKVVVIGSVFILSLVLLGCAPGKQGVSTVVPDQGKATQVPVADNNAGSWKSCTNASAGFTMKYPSLVDFDTQNCVYSFENGNKAQSISVTDVLSDFRKNWMLQFVVYDEPGTLKDWMETNCSIPASSGKLACGTPKAGPIKDSLQYGYVNTTYTSIHTVVKIKNKVLDFALEPRKNDLPENPEVTKLYNQILTTVTFTQ